MNNKIIAAGALLVLSASSACFADDPAAKADLQQRLSQMQQYQADFSQTVSDSEGEVVHQAQGQLTMARPDKLRWHTSSPDETLLVADGEAVWNLDPFVEQVTIINQQAAVQDNPIILLTSADDSVWQQFDIEYALGGSDSFVIKPIDGEGQIQSLSLTFDQQTLQSLAMTDAQSQVSELTFAAIQTAFTPQPGTFEVQVPETYMVDDQR